MLLVAGLYELVIATPWPRRFTEQCAKVKWERCLSTSTKELGRLTSTKINTYLNLNFSQSMLNIIIPH